MSSVPSDPLISGPTSFPLGAPASSTSDPTRGRGRRRLTVTSPATMRVTAVLGPEHSVTVSGPDLDLRRVITLLNDTLSKARKAQSQNMSLATFVSLLRDQAMLTLRSQPGS